MLECGVGSGSIEITSAPIGAWKCNFMPCKEINQMTSQKTDMSFHLEFFLPINCILLLEVCPVAHNLKRYFPINNHVRLLVGSPFQIYK